jgi:hypothetical protein
MCPVLMLESYLSKMIPDNFVILSWEISFKKFGKRTDFQQNWTKQLKRNLFLHFLSFWVLRKGEKGRYSQKYEKK